MQLAAGIVQTMSTAQQVIAELNNAPEEVAREALKFILVLKQRSSDKFREADSMGYPAGYFERTSGSFAKEPLERPAQASLDPAPVW